MSLEENKASLRKMVEAINQHDIPLAKSFIAAGCVDHTFQIKGPEGYEKFLSLVFAGFPDFHVKVGDMIAEKDKVCVLGRFVGTHTGAYYDPSIDRELAPTGRTISFPFCMVYRLLNGKVYTYTFVFRKSERPPTRVMDHFKCCCTSSGEDNSIYARPTVCRGFQKSLSLRP